MASDSRVDDAATDSLRQGVGKLVSGLSRAVFGVCAVAVGLIALFVGAGTTGDSASVFLIVGIASVSVGFVTISRLPKPSDSAGSTDIITEVDDSTVQTAASDDATAASNDAAVANEATGNSESDHHRQQVE